MKRYLTYILLIISSICYGQLYSTTNSNIQYNGFRSTSYYNQPIRGYNTINYNTQRIGYTMQNYGYSTYKGTYTPTNNSNSGYNGIRKSPQRPDPDNDNNDEHRMNKRWWDILNLLGYDANWPGYVDADYWTEFLEEYPEYEEYVRNWFERHPGFPNDPFATPIGEFPIGLLLICIFGYLYYKMYKIDK